MDVTENVVFRTGPGNGEVQVLVARVVVQVAIRWAVSNEEVDVVWQGVRPFEVRAGRDAIELDSVILDAAVLQKDNTARDEVAGPDRVSVEDAVMVAGDEDSEFRWDGAVPYKEVLQVCRVEAFAGISGTDEDVCICGDTESPIHPVSVGECENLMTLIVNKHYNRIASMIGWISFLIAPIVLLHPHRLQLHSLQSSCSGRILPKNRQMQAFRTF